MSKEVKRYELRIVDRYAGDGTGDIETDARMKHEAKGRYVLFSDYAALLAERDRLKKDARRALPGISEQMTRDIRRFRETCEDGQGYDVPRDRMRAMASFGLVRWCGGSRFEITDCGDAALEFIDAALQGEQP